MTKRAGVAAHHFWISAILNGLACRRAVQEMVRRAVEALAAGRRGDALPQGFTFGGCDNRCAPRHALRVSAA